MNIQRQPNNSDCGVFALACATELVHNKDPVDVSKMKQHIIEIDDWLQINAWYLDDGTLCGSPGDLAAALKDRGRGRSFP